MARRTARGLGWVRKATPAEALTAARQMERGASRRYASMAHHAGSPALRAKLRWLAADEAEHARALSQMLKSLPKPGPGFRPSADLSEVEGGPAGDDLRSALEMAISAEREAREFYETAARLCAAAETRAVFESLARTEERHEQMLAATQIGRAHV